MDSSFPYQLKNRSHSVKIKNAVRHGYTMIIGERSGSSPIRTKKDRIATVSRIPITPQSIHDGKNDPRILNEGAREHPAVNSIAAEEIPTLIA
jgi:hypothetical protein